MSSTVMEDSLTDSLPPTKGTPEHQAYYYDKLERSMYNYIKEALELCPDILMCRAWVSLGYVGQKSLVEKVKGIYKYEHCHFDIEDQEQVDALVSTLLGGFLIDVPDLEREPQKDINLKNPGQNRASSNPPLNKRDHQIKTNPTNGKKKTESNRLLKTAITRSHVRKAQTSPISSYLP